MKKYVVPVLLMIMIGLGLFVNYALGDFLFIYFRGFGGVTPTKIQSILNFIQYIFILCIYLVVIFLLWQEKTALEQYNLDQLSIILLGIMGVIGSAIAAPGKIFFKTAIILLSLLLFAFFLKRAHQIPKTKGRWILLGLAACLVVIPLSFIASLDLHNYSPVSYSIHTLISAISNIGFYTLAYVSPIEEFLFRSILWGYLRQRSWSEKKIFWSQAVLFLALHINHLVTPLSFFIVLPVVILIMSYYVYRSKQIFPAIILHTVLDTLLPILASYIYFIRLAH